MTLRDRFFENDSLFETTSRESKKLFSELQNVFDKILSNGHLSLTNFDKNDENQVMCNLKLDSMPDTANEIDLEELIARSARRFRRAGLAIEPDTIQVFSNEEFLASYEEDAKDASENVGIIIEETNLGLSSSESQASTEEFNTDDTNNQQEGALVPELEIFTSAQPVTTSTSTSKIVIVEIPNDYSDPASEVLESEYDFRYQDGSEDDLEDIEDVEIIEDVNEMNPANDEVDDSASEDNHEDDSDEGANPGLSETEEIVVEIDEFDEMERQNTEDSNPDVFSETEEIIFYEPSEVFDSSSNPSSSIDIDDSETETVETIILSETFDDTENADTEDVILEDESDANDYAVADDIDTSDGGDTSDDTNTSDVTAVDKETKKSDDPQTGAVSDDNDSTSMVLWAVILLIALVIIVG